MPVTVLLFWFRFWFWLEVVVKRLIGWRGRKENCWKDILVVIITLSGALVAQPQLFHKTHILLVDMPHWTASTSFCWIAAHIDFVWSPELMRLGLEVCGVGSWISAFTRTPDLRASGLILGYNSLKFKRSRGTIRPEQGSLFAILVSFGLHLIWKLRVNRVITNPAANLTEANIHNQWLKGVNATVRRDRILIDKIKFGPLAMNKQVVLNTWSGLLMDEDSLPDDWTLTEGLLVGMWPLNGIG
ncbi:hypothetical protein B0H19DRAFT_1066399 [Mycena capillaripes]|nr:hypothetical protein B0H19DRAFT_1066399 [Mycena capillaripes]